MIIILRYLEFILGNKDFREEYYSSDNFSIRSNFYLIMVTKCSKILMIAGELVAFIIENASSQFLSGTVYEMTGQGKNPLPGANIFWIGTMKGTSTDEKGNYQLP